MLTRAPIWLQALKSPGAGAFATLFGLESSARAVLATLIVVFVSSPTLVSRLIAA